jgi:hypothetical protein
LPLVLIGAITAYGVGVAHGKQCLNVGFPDRTQIDGSTLTLNGLGLRQATPLKVNVYVAALYVTKASPDPNAILGAPAPKQLILHFVRSVGRSDVNTAWDEGFEANAKQQLPGLEERIETLKTLMTDMKSGERLTFTHWPSRGVQVIVGGAAKGTVEGDDFAKAFFSIWLGPHPPSSDLKAGLLGGPCG